MPITPLHLGPGSLAKVALGSYLSLSVFTFAQILMDVEVIARVLIDSEKIHGFTNTILGATVILIPSVLVGKPVCEWCLRWWNQNLDDAQAKLLSLPSGISWTAASVGAAVGVYSHWFLDALMHADADVFWPWQTGNRFVSLMSTGTLNRLCMVTLLLGFGVLIACRLIGILRSRGD